MLWQTIRIKKELGINIFLIKTVINMTEQNIALYPVSHMIYVSSSLLFLIDCIINKCYCKVPVLNRKGHNS